MQSRQDCFATICLSTHFTLIADMTDVQDWFEPSTLADFEILDSLSDFDNDTCPFVARTLGAQLTHLGQSPIVQHEVDVGQAKTCGIDLE